jgi:hypothetical protein
MLAEYPYTAEDDGLGVIMQASFRLVTALDNYPVAHLQVVLLAADFLDHTHRLVPEDVAPTLVHRTPATC